MRFWKRLLMGAAAVMAPTLAFAADAAAAPTVDTGVTAWMLVSTVLVLLMLPGLAMFYGGLVRTKNVVGTMMHSYAAMAIVGVLWAVVGYSMAFGKNVLGGWFGWNDDYFLLKGIDTTIMSYGIPEYVFAMFQGKFAIITPALIAGAFAERVKFKAFCFFVALWSLFVYNPLCHWIWAADGFLCGKAIDLAGGTVIHISSGVAGLVAALYLGKRFAYPKTAMRPNNLTMTLIGAGLLWVGWFGFNAGSTVAAGLSTGQALTMTQIAAAMGGLTWVILEGIIHRKATSLGMASGILAGLVAITPAAGVVLPVGALALGALAACGSFFAVTVIKSKLGYDDSLDAFGVHGVSGMIGAIGLVFFLRPGASALTFAEQLKYQVEGAALAVVYSAVVTFIIVFVLDKTMGFRMKEEEEKAGMDHSEHGEHGYGLTNLC
jgi:Amt family ammonium transporter